MLLLEYSTYLDKALGFHGISRANLDQLAILHTPPPGQEL